MRRAAVLWVIGVVVLLAGGAITFFASSKSAPSRFSASEVLSIARRDGALEGDGHPTHIAEVRSTHERAVRVISEGRTTGVGEPGLAVDVITMHGHFTAYTASPPPGDPIPQGSWLTLILNARTGARRVTRLADKRPPLARLGRVRYISAER